MINFDHINEFSKSYDINNRYLRFTHNHLYYRKIDIVGRENIPPRGTPTLVISNHQNGLMDALAILYLFDDHRQPVFIARGDIFKKDSIAKMLRYLKILPAFRSRDGGRDDVKRNLDFIELEGRILNEGGTLAMFPEAGHQAGHFMTTFKKGFPRIAFKAEEMADFNLNLQILPLNIYYDNYFNFRGYLSITVGKPFTISEFFEKYKLEPNKAFAALNEKARAAIKAMTLDIEDKEHYEEYDILRQMSHTPLKELGKDSATPLYEQQREDIETVRKLDEMRATEPEKFANLMSAAREYLNGLQKLNLRDWLINYNIKATSLIFKTLLLIILAPVYLFGLINNIIPFKLPEPLKRKMNDRMFSSSVNYALSVLITFPLWYLILFVAAWVVSGQLWFAAAYLFAAFCSLFFFFKYKKWFIKWRASCRYYIMCKSGNKMLQKIKELKKNILTY